MARVLVLTSTFPRWPDDATPRFVLDLSSQLAALGWRMHVLAPGHDGARKDEELEGVTVHRFPYMVPARLQTLSYGGGIMPNVRERPARLALIPPFLASAGLAARRLVRHIKPDLVHAHWIVPMGLVATMALPKSVPLVVTVHGSDALQLKGRVMDRLKRSVLARAIVLTCNGSKTEAAIAPMLSRGKRMVRIPMGAERPESRAEHGIALPEGRFKVLFAGRLFRGKGLDDLLDAIAAFEAGQRPLLFVAGSGPEADRFRARATRLGIGDDVRFLGGLEHRRLLSLMRDMDAVVVPTRTSELIEAQGLVIAEAMFAGAPVVATRGGGAEDHVADGRTGVLVPPSNPAALRGALARFIAEPESARAMAETAEAYARDHLSWPASARAFDAVYKSVLPEGAGMPRFRRPDPQRAEPAANVHSDSAAELRA